MIPVDRFPSLCESLRGLDDRATKALVRELLKAAAAWSIECDGSPPGDLIADLRHAIGLELGESMREHLLKQLSRLTPTNERN